MFDPETLDLATAVLAACRARGWHVATAESCTGGLVAAALTAIAGSSDVVERGFVTYSNEAKAELLGVPPKRSPRMARSAPRPRRRWRRARSRAPPVDLAVSITGVAGPGGGSAEKPVGLVHFGLARRGRTCRTEHHIFPGDRAAVRDAALQMALELLAAEARAE